jgi:hypothetical protein
VLLVQQEALGLERKERQEALGLERKERQEALGLERKERQEALGLQLKEVLEALALAHKEAQGPREALGSKEMLVQRVLEQRGQRVFKAHKDLVLVRCIILTPPILQVSLDIMK